MDDTVVVESVARTDIVSILEKAKFHVVAHGNNDSDAIELCREYYPDVVILDIKAPNFEGFSAASIVLREEEAGCVVMLTAFGEEGFVERVKQSGTTGYLVKPSEERTMARTIEIAISQGVRLRVAKEHNMQILRKLEERKVIDQAKAVIAERNGITELEAYGSMQSTAIDKRISISEVASLVVDTPGDYVFADKAKRTLMKKHRSGERIAFQRIKELSEKANISLYTAAAQLLQENSALQ